MALVVTDLQTQTQWALVAMPAPILLCACPFPASRLRTWRTGVGWCPFLRKRVIKLLSASFGPRPKLGGGSSRHKYRLRSARTGTGVVTTVTPTLHVTLNLFQGPFILSGSGFDARWTPEAEGWQRQNKFRVTNMEVDRTD